MSIIIFIISLAILVLVHEFGHFIVAKKSGIRVDEFGLGFPPKIFAKKWGETTYTLNAIPFGGFVKIFGEDQHQEAISEEDKKTSFVHKPKYIQAAVLVAGVTMNIIFAWLLISLGFVIGLPTPVDAGYGNVINPQLTIVEVLPGSPAELAGLRSGDVIVSASNEKQTVESPNITPENVSQVIADSEGANVGITYTRGSGIPTKIVVASDTTTVPGKRAIGIGMDNIGLLKLSIPRALLEGASTTWQLTKATAVGLVSFLASAVTFKADFSQVSGPVGIAGVVGQARQLGFVYLLSLVALISINLAVINLLPFPALDGGRLLFVGIEAIIRRPISPKVVQWTNTIGFTFLLILMLVVTGHDIFKLL